MINWTHWTPKGTLKIEPVTLLGALHFRLWFGETDLGVYLSLVTAAASIGEGKHDQRLGLKVSRLDVPPFPHDWNGLK
jgi:hypothetical protein